MFIFTCISAIVTLYCIDVQCLLVALSAFSFVPFLTKGVPRYHSVSLILSDTHYLTISAKCISATVLRETSKKVNALSRGRDLVVKLGTAFKGRG